MNLDKVYPVSVLVICLVIAVLAVVVPFRQQRLYFLDSQTAKSMKKVSSGIKTYYSTNNKLPDNLDAVVKEQIEGYYSQLSAESIKNVTYKKLESNQFQLCGKFYTDTMITSERQSEIDSDVSSPLSGLSSLSSSGGYSQHKKGDYCFDKESAGYGTLSNDYYSNSKLDSLYTSGGGSSATSQSARDSERAADVRALASNAEMYFAQNGTYPANCTELATAAVSDSSILETPNGSTSSKAPTYNCADKGTPSQTNDIYVYSPKQDAQNTKEYSAFSITYWSESEKSVKTRRSIN